jgi:hypothetical protein
VGSIDAELGLTALAAMLSPTTLSFSILSLVLSEKPRRTGLWFFLGAFGLTVVIGVVAAFVIGDSAASPKPSTPKTWVAIVDLVAGALLLLFAIRLFRRPVEPERIQGAVGRMEKVASSPAIAIVAAGATLANPGGFIPIALKDISELNPTAAEYILLWLGFAIISLLPLILSVLMLTFARERAELVLGSARAWIERNAMKLAAAIMILLAASLISHGIAGVTA